MNYHVYVRVRPSLNVADTCTISPSPYCRNAIILSDGIEERYYDANHLFTDACSNEQVAAVILPRLLDAVRRGQTAVCLAYGQTGSGKTHTILGTREYPGIIFSAYYALLGAGVSIALSMIEIYNESIYDLLNEKREIKPRNDSSNYLTLPNLQQHECYSMQLFRYVIYAAMDVRITRKTLQNESSSRSHLLLIVRYFTDTGTEGELIFGDLAGSENFTDNKSVAGKEGISINKSLLALNNVILNMSRGRYPSFRDSNLTRLLQRGFYEGLVSLLTNVTKFDYRETRRTLYLAHQTRLIKVQPAPGICPDKNQSHCEHLVIDKRMIYKCVRSVLNQCIDYDDAQLRAMLYTTGEDVNGEDDSDDVSIEVPVARLERIYRFNKLSDAVLYAICEVLPRIRSVANLAASGAVFASATSDSGSDAASEYALVALEQLTRIKRKNEENSRLLHELIIHSK